MTPALREGPPADRASKPNDALHDHAAHTQPHIHGAMASPPLRREVRLRVAGMHCAGCAASVQQAIEGVRGVQSATVDVIDGRASAIGEGLDPQAIAAAIRATGYQAEPIDQLPAPAELRSEIELRQQQHERQWKRRAIIALSIWAPLEALHWIGQAAGWHAGHALGWLDWIMLIGASVVIVAAGGGFYRSAWSAAKRFTTNMDTLIAIGATTAYVFSLVVFIAKLFGRLHEQPLYFSESAALLGLISLGHWLEARATAKAGSAVRELLELQPDTAEVVKRQNVETSKPQDELAPVESPTASSGSSFDVSTFRHFDVSSVPSASVKPGDALLIRPGARVPVDGVVLDGESDVNEAVVTGESMPVHKRPGDSVVAGSINGSGRLIVQATVDGRHTTIARIAEMVQRAQSSKANIQRLADYVASIFVPSVLAIALVTLIGWWLAGDFSTGVIATVTVLIISCPCALGLATPMAVMVGAGAASRRGILVKSAAALERAGGARIVVFDKTGTLTVGQPRVTALLAAPAWRSEDLLSLAAAVEAPSEHPIARAILAEAARRRLHLPPVRNFQAIPGVGVRGDVGGKAVEVLRDDEGQATCRVLVNGREAGTVTVADEPRGDAREAIAQLRRMGLGVRMLSGDRRSAAEAIGRELGFAPDEVIAEATPETKVRVVEEIVRESRRGHGENEAPTHLPSPSLKEGDGAVVMVGDGINDAAALAAADLGIAMASGTNIAIESAAVVIPGDRVRAVAQTIDLSKRTLRTIKQNLFFAFFYNAAAIPAAALGLLGPYGPLIAAAAMGASDITVIGNALRLKASLAKDETRKVGDA